MKADSLIDPKLLMAFVTRLKAAVTRLMTVVTRIMTVVMLPLMTVAYAQDDDFFFADEADEADDVPASREHDSSIEIGLGYLNSGTRHFGRDTGLTGKSFEPLVNIRSRSLPDREGGNAYFWRAEAHRLGWDSQRFAIEAGEQGKQTFAFSWRELPSHRVEDGQTPFFSENSGFFTLPSDWEVTGNTTGGQPALQESLSRVNIGTKRERLDLGYWRSLSERWSVNVDFRNETKQGSRINGGIFGFSGGNPRGALLPVPVDQTTRIIDAELEYSADRYLIGLAYHGSFFENRRRSVSWQNPFGQHPQWVGGTGFPDGIGRLALSPDNEFHQLRTYGTWRLGERSRFNANFALGRMQQDDTFMPFTVNRNIDLDAPLPRDSLNGRINTTLLDLRLTTQPVNRLNLVFNYRYDDRDNDTAQNVYQVVGADSGLQASFESARINLPYSYRKQELKGDATWRLTGRHRLVGGLQFMQEDRDNFAEVADLDEWTVRAGVRGALGPKVDYRINYAHSDRNYDRYDGRAPFVAGHIPGAVGPDAFENHPNLRKYNMADRQRDQLETRLGYQPIDTLNVGLSFRYSKDDYDDQRFGLTEARVRSLSADGGYYPDAHLSISGFYSRDRYDAGQNGRDWPGNAPQLAFNPDRDWSADHRDRVDTINLSLQLSDATTRFEALRRAGINRQLDMGFDFLLMRTRGEIDVSTGATLNAEPFPDTVNRLNAYTIWARYQFNTQWHARISVENNRFASRNFALDNVAVDTLSDMLLFGQQSPDYNATWVMLSIGHQFR